MKIIDYLFCAVYKSQERQNTGLEFFMSSFLLAFCTFALMISIVSILQYYDLDLGERNKEYAGIVGVALLICFHLFFYFYYKSSSWFIKAMEWYEHLSFHIHPIIIFFVYLFICSLGIIFTAFFE